MKRYIDEDELRKRAKDVTLGNGAKYRCIDTTLLNWMPAIEIPEAGREYLPGTAEHYEKWLQQHALRILQKANREGDYDMAEYAKERISCRNSEYKSYKALFFDKKSEKWTDNKDILSVCDEIADTLFDPGMPWMGAGR